MLHGEASGPPAAARGAEAPLPLTDAELVPASTKLITPYLARCFGLDETTLAAASDAAAGHSSDDVSGSKGSGAGAAGQPVGPALAPVGPQPGLPAPQPPATQGVATRDGSSRRAAGEQPSYAGEWHADMRARTLRAGSACPIAWRAWDQAVAAWQPGDHA